MESLSRPLNRNQAASATLSRKLSNGNGFSAKDAYDGVFAGPPKFGAPTYSSRVEDYKEIFGGSQASRTSSIPILDLSALEEENVSPDIRSSKLDYSNIFAGFREEDVGVSYEELFARPKGGKSSARNHWNPTERGSPLQGSDHLNHSEENQVPSSETSYQSFDGVKQFNMSYHKTSQRSKDGTNGTTHVAQLHAVPGFTCFVDKMASPPKADIDKPKPPVISGMHRSMDFSEGIPDGKHSGKAVSHPADGTTPGGVVKSRSGSSWDGSYSNGKFFNAYEINLKSHPSKVFTPSSMPINLDNNKGHSKRSVASSFVGPKSDASVGAAGDSSPPSSDEELDINSAAAASVAALKEAIEKAQESIRIAKELMERKKVGLQSCSNWSSKDSLKLEDRRQKRVSCEGNRTEKNAKETSEKMNSVMQVFHGIEKKNASKSGEVAPGFKDGREHFIVRKIVRETLGESGEEHEAATWFSKLVPTEKHKTATLAFEQRNSKNNLVPSIDKHECEFKEMKTTEETLKKQKDNVKKLQADGETYEMADMEGKLNAIEIKKELKENVNKLESAHLVHEEKGNEKSEIYQEDEETEKQKCFSEQENCTKKGSQETMNENKFEFQERKENDYDKRLNDAEEQGDNDRKQQDAPEEEKLEKRIENGPGKEENKNVPGKECDGEEIEKRLDEACQMVENEDEMRAPYAAESNEKQQKDFHEDENTKNRLDEVHEPEIDEKRPTDALDGEERDTRSKEEHHWETIKEKLTGAYRYEENQSIKMAAVQSKENEEIEVNLEAVYETNFGIAGGACKHDAVPAGDECKNDTSEKIHETQEACRNGVNDNCVDKSQEVHTHEENGSTLRLITASFEYKENENETGAFEVAHKLKRRENLQTAGLVEGADDDDDDDEIENKTKGASEALASDDIAANSGFTDMDFGQKETKQNNKECELASTLEIDAEILVHESGEDTENFKEHEITFDRGEGKVNFLSVHDQRQLDENGRKPEATQLHSAFNREEKTVEIDEGIETSQNTEKEEVNLRKTLTTEEKEDQETKQKEERTMEIDEGIETSQNTEKDADNLQKTLPMDEKEDQETKQKEEEKEHLKKIDEANRRERERERDRVAVERAIREARERAFAEARERAERAAVEKATAEVRQRVMAEAREKLGKASTATKSSVEKASIEAKRKAERAAVERATEEARERALEKALSQKTTSVARAQAERSVAEKFSGASRDNGLKQSFSSSDLHSFDGTNTESAQRCKARLERHHRIMERAAKALAEKNVRDLLAQKEQADRNRLAETLDADIKRWSLGKEGNLRALLSTLQYILGPDSGWQPISLTDLITTNAVKKTYRKSALYVHPDKLQQRGANIRQKYICEKVFDLLQAAWNKFNREER